MKLDSTTATFRHRCKIWRRRRSALLPGTSHRTRSLKSIRIRNPS
uniref:Uncharacterized protein n=1 Tax=Setaria viridis TaxID=4556 RepID=A0A4U6TLH6_SETVI|nr:hypothetical protein SEVIR_8G221700v2 [Setaria viridis]